jgi:hypothetical protein
MGDEPTHILLPLGEVPERSEGDEGLMNSRFGLEEPLTCLANVSASDTPRPVLSQSLNPRLQIVGSLD